MKREDLKAPTEVVNIADNGEIFVSKLTRPVLQSGFHIPQSKNSPNA